jgi:dipeptidyl-peptidase-4
LHWIDGRRFTWTSTRTGWRHLYLHDLDTGATSALTAGDFEVLDVLGVKDGRAVVVSNEGEMRERHVWSVPLDGSPRRRLTEGRGVHTVLASPGMRLAVHRTDNAESPGVAALIDLADGSAIRPLAASRVALLAEHGVIAPEFVRIPRDGDDALEAMLWLPRAADGSAPFPTLIQVYGGPHAPLVRDQWAGIGALWRSLLAQLGIAVCVVDPISASGRGDASAYRMHRRAGVTELEDVHAAMDWLVARGTSDPERFGIFGWSYGGFMASYAMTHSTRFRAGVAGAPVTDWRNYDSVYTETYMGTPQDTPEGYAAASVIAAAASLQGRFLLIHGTMDENVHVSNSLQLAKALQTAGKDFRLMLYPNSRHGVTEPKLQAHLYAMITAFLRQNLRGDGRN